MDTSIPKSEPPRRVNWPLLVQRHWPYLQERLQPCVGAIIWSERATHAGPGRTVFEEYDARPGIASCVLVEICGRWCVLTAGHVIDNFKYALHHGRIVFRLELVAGLHTNDSNPAHIQLPLELTRWLIINDSQSVDYALFPLPSEAVSRLIETNAQVVPFELFSQNRTAFDAFVLLGSPQQELLVKPESVDQQTCNLALRIGTLMLPVIEVDDPSSQMSEAKNQFHGRILTLQGRYVQSDEDRQLHEISGMSGGPVFGLRFNDESVDVGLVAIQSKWNSTSNVIMACRVGSFASELVESLGHSRGA